MEILGQLAVNFYLSLGNMFNVLLFLSTLDIITGMLAAVVEKNVSSKASWAGMARKAIQFLVVLMAKALESVAGGMEISVAVATFFCATEGISILENAGRAGVPWPPFLRDVLKNLNSASRIRIGETTPVIPAGRREYDPKVIPMSEDTPKIQ